MFFFLFSLSGIAAFFALSVGARPWVYAQDASKQWKDASPLPAWKHATLAKPLEYMPEPYNDAAVRECQMPLRRMG
jgi:hypothetical protein